jgi:putative spermidine/putrescine transport system substrate-binding protein
MKRMSTLASVAVLALALAGCGTSDGNGGNGGGGGGTGDAGFTAPDLPMKKSLGDYEGEVDILAWPYYAEDGSNDPKADWVTPFEKETGCQVNV